MVELQSMTLPNKATKTLIIDITKRNRREPHEDQDQNPSKKLPQSGPPNGGFPPFVKRKFLAAKRCPLSRRGIGFVQRAQIGLGVEATWD